RPHEIGAEQHRRRRAEYREALLERHPTDLAAVVDSGAELEPRLGDVSPLDPESRYEPDAGIRVRQPNHFGQTGRKDPVIGLNDLAVSALRRDRRERAVVVVDLAQMGRLAEQPDSRIALR